MSPEPAPATDGERPGRRRFVLLTRSTWAEPPRLRHQVAEMLAAAGHDVLFGERPTGVFRRGNGLSNGTTGDIALFSHRELVHHKLRANGPIRAANAALASASLRHALREFGLSPADVVLNFNYDYCFLRRVFPDNPVVTIINDDFVTSAPRPIQPALYRAQDLTCKASDAVLCTSPVVMNRLRAGPEPELFLPWAAEPYVRPPALPSRNVLLYWGYLGHRLDRHVVRNIAGWSAQHMPDMKILLVGPGDPGSNVAAEFERLPNVEVSGPMPIGRLPFDRVFASFIPYVEGVAEIDAIVFPNKLFQLLAKGTPMVISGMPHFPREPFVFRVAGRSEEEDMATLLRARNSFDALQDGISDFMKSHGQQGRLAQLMSVVSRAEDRRRAAR